jgi:2-methylcitrate synthase
MACQGLCLYWFHFSHSGRRIDETDDDSIGGHFRTSTDASPRPGWLDATSLNLYGT